jgi:hypothetical protein
MQVWVKGFVDISLELSRCSHEPIEYDQRFTKAIPGTNGCLPDIFFLYPVEAKGITNANFGNVLHFG